MHRLLRLPGGRVVVSQLHPGLFLGLGSGSLAFRVEGLGFRVPSNVIHVLGGV